MMTLVRGNIVPKIIEIIERSFRGLSEILMKNKLFVNPRDTQLILFI